MAGDVQRWPDATIISGDMQIIHRIGLSYQFRFTLLGMDVNRITLKIGVILLVVLTCSIAAAMMVSMIGIAAAEKSVGSKPIQGVGTGIAARNPVFTATPVPGTTGITPSIPIPPPVTQQQGQVPLTTGGQYGYNPQQYGQGFAPGQLPAQQWTGQQSPQQFTRGTQGQPVYQGEVPDHVVSPKPSPIVCDPIHDPGRCSQGGPLGPPVVG